MYKSFLSFIELNKEKVQYGQKGIVLQEWIDDVEKELGFQLPDSYKWWCMEFEFMTINNSNVYSITSPDERELAYEIDILNVYNTDVENDTLDENQLNIFSSGEGDEIYYFKIVPGLEGNEYKVYLKDYYSDNDDIYADNFLDFLEKIITETT